jgi:hypothetical protein
MHWKNSFFSFYFFLNWGSAVLFLKNLNVPKMTGKTCGFLRNFENLRVKKNGRQPLFFTSRFEKFREEHQKIWVYLLFEIFLKLK